MTSPASQVLRFRDATEIADWRLCIGCGACVYACDEDRLQMADHVTDGLRPVHVPGRDGRAATPATVAAGAGPGTAHGSCSTCNDCVSVCPGLGATHAAPRPGDGTLEDLRAGWGPVLEVWEGYATDTAMRAAGSSAGLATVLALHGIESGSLHGVLHIGSDDGARWLNRTVLSTTPDELLSRTGSRYAPASPCDHLERIEEADGPCAFIGKPCDVEALRKAQALRPALDAKVGLAIGIFCAGTPSTQGTLDLLAKHGIAREDVEDLRYRGRGWPGTFAVKLRGQDEWRDLASYAEAWGFLQAYRPHRCYLCPDGTSEFADVSCGDPWYHDTEAHQPGISLVLVRTERGRVAVQAAMAAGIVQLRRVGAEALERSQAELQRKRGAIWGRLLTLEALGVPAPRFGGFPLFRHWLRLPFMQKARSFVGTARRVFARGYRRSLSSQSASAQPTLPDEQALRRRGRGQRAA
jgi:coenzyme F420 hydrogenase subunit beta